MKMNFSNGVLRSANGSMGRTSPMQNRKPVDMSLDRLQRIAVKRDLSICIKRSLGGIGDILMSTPALRAIKHQWPNCKLTYATDFAYMDGGLKLLLENNPFIDELIAYQVIGAKDYDIVTDITGVCIGQEKIQPGGTIVPNRIDLFAGAIGVSLNATGYVPTYIVKNEEIEFAKEKLKEFRVNKKHILIGIQPRASCFARSWPLNKVIELVNILGKDGRFKCFIFDSKHGFGQKETWNFPNVVSLSDYNIRATAAMMNEMDIIVTPDSGLMHLAGALNKKSVVVFGGIDYRSRINHYVNATPVARFNYNCYPCFYEAAVCNRTFACLQAISADEVYRTILEVAKNDTKPIPAVTSTTTKEPSSNNVSELDDYSKKDSLIIRDDGIGDLVSCLPAFAGFKKKHPDKKLALATYKKNIGLMKLSGVFDNLVSLVGKHDKLIPQCKIHDARNLFEKNRPKDGKGLYYETKPRNVAMAEFLDTKVDEDFIMPLDLASIEYCKQLLLDRGVDINVDKIVTFQMRSTAMCRTWNRDYYRPLIKEIFKLGYIPVAIGNIPDDIYNTINCVSTIGKLDILQFNAMVSISSAFIGVDSGGVHLAGINRIPFVAIFNVIPPELRLNLYHHYKVIYPNNINCVPCWDKGCSSMECMKEITPEIVIQNLKELIG